MESLKGNMTCTNELRDRLQFSGGFRLNLVKAQQLYESQGPVSTDNREFCKIPDFWRENFLECMQVRNSSNCGKDRKSITKLVIHKVMFINSCIIYTSMYDTLLQDHSYMEGV